MAGGAALDARGHTTSDSNTLTSGLSIIHVDGEKLVGGAGDGVFAFAGSGSISGTKVAL